MSRVGEDEVNHRRKRFVRFHTLQPPCQEIAQDGQVRRLRVPASGVMSVDGVRRRRPCVRSHRSLATQPAPTSKAPLVSSHVSWQSHKTSGAMYSGLRALAKASGMTPLESLCLYIMGEEVGRL